MPGVDAVAERMADYLVGHHSKMPGLGKTLQTLVATRRLEDSAHAFHDDKSSVVPRQDSIRPVFPMRFWTAWKGALLTSPHPEPYAELPRPILRIMPGQARVSLSASEP